MSLLAAAALLLAALAAPGPAPAQVKLSRSGICHCPGGAYWERTLRFTPFPSIESCLATGGRHPKVGQGDCDAPAAARVSPVPSPEEDGPRYDRALFGGWADADGDCRSTRHEVLAELSIGPVRWSADSCEAEHGALNRPLHRPGPPRRRRASTSTTWCPWPMPGARGADAWERGRGATASAVDPARTSSPPRRG